MKKNDSKNKGNRDKLGRLLPGHGGRPKGSKNKSGLGSVLKMFYDLISEDDSIEILYGALKGELNNNPKRMWRQYIMPLFPKNIDIKSKIEFDTDASDAAKKMSDDELDKI